MSRRQKQNEVVTETPQSKERHIAADQHREAKAGAVEVDKWYEQHGDKIREIVQKKNGSKSSRYLFNVAKNPQKTQELKKAGLLHLGKRLVF